ncbi:MAG: 3-hydroxyacyl-ACP dehydratase FabZ [Thiotrichales bacterium]
MLVDTSQPTSIQIDIQEVMNLLPHRYPLLLIDRVLAFNPGESLTALKNVTFNEPFFQGHFPGHPIMPGVLIMEALAQASGIYEFASRKANNEPRDFLYLFVAIDNARFRRPVVPGDQLILRIEPISKKRNMMKVNALATVDDKVVATAELMCAQQEINA